MPRRTAWASQVELAELYDMIYAPHADDQSRQKALSRMSIYLSSPSCPSFIHLFHSLLSADLLPVVGAAEIQSTRLSCAMAIVRFINGMVDPLQTGPYARPISHIAASLKIPQSLISLRHRATHEDLPPLPLLKQAVHSAIEYINQYSFLPSLASTSSDPITRSLRAENLVGRWKKLIKARSRGEIGGPESEREEKTLIREIDGEDMGEMAEALAAVGGLIPLAKRKRSSLQSAEPTKASLQIWSPLIKHLSQRDPQFVNSLVQQLSTIVVKTDRKDAEKSSIRWSAAVWILQLWSDRTDLPSPDHEVKTRIRREILAALINRDEILTRFSEELADIDTLFQNATIGLEDVWDEEDTADDDDNLAGLELVEDQDTHSTAMELDGDDMLAQMEARLARLSSRNTGTGFVPAPSNPNTDHSHTKQPNNGWNRLDHNSWKPCPIGAWGSAPASRVFA